MSDLILKSLARVTDTNPDDAPYGGFEAIASTPERDRDGDVIKQADWSPLPDRVTIDVDHSMNVRGTIGSAHPYFDEEGNLRISARFASTSLAQEVRSLMTEGHIDSVSVAFMKSTNLKSADGEKETSLELLNVGVVAIPSNRGAKVLASKSLEIADAELGIKEADNSSEALKHVQAIHDHAVLLGAKCNQDESQDEAEDAKEGKSVELPADVAGEPEVKSSVETSDSLSIADGEKASNADVITEDTDSEHVHANDSVLKEALSLLSAVDASTLPAEVTQAIALIKSLNDPDDATDNESSDPAEKAVSVDALSAAVNSRALNFVFECEALSISTNDTE